MVSIAKLARVSLSLYLWLVAQSVSAVGLQITAMSQTVELGKPVWLTLTSDQTTVSLNTIDFSPWQRDFVLPRQSDLSISDDNRSQRLRMQLFPLRKGRLNLPPLSFLNQQTKAMPIEVIAARDAKSHSPIEFDCQQSSSTPWQQQQVIVACNVITRDAYVVFAQPSDRIIGAQLTPMQVQQRQVHADGEVQTRYQLGWVLIPSRAGEMQVQLPPIQYLRDGVVTHQFYAAPLNLQVQALPAWLPGTIPVGTLALTRYRLPQWWLSTSVLSHVQLQLQLAGMAADAIPAYAQQLRSDNAVQYYSAQQNLLTTIDSQGIHHRLNYDIPVVAKHIGIYRLPGLRLQYFDPDTGKLVTTEIRGPSLFILNGWLKSLLLILGTVILAWVGRSLLQWWLRQWRRYQAYRLLLQVLPQTDSLPAIRHIMHSMAQAEGWSTNLSYLQWQRRMQAVAPIARMLAVNSLNAASYAHAEISLTPIVQVLTRICRARRFAVR